MTGLASNAASREALLTWISRSCVTATGVGLGAAVTEAISFGEEKGIDTDCIVATVPISHVEVKSPAIAMPVSKPRDLPERTADPPKGATLLNVPTANAILYSSSKTRYTGRQH
jgi:hypothetical protein